MREWNEVIVGSSYQFVPLGTKVIWVIYPKCARVLQRLFEFDWNNLARLPKSVADRLNKVCANIFLCPFFRWFLYHEQLLCVTYQADIRKFRSPATCPRNAQGSDMAKV